VLVLFAAPAVFSQAADTDGADVKTPEVGVEAQGAQSPELTGQVKPEAAQPETGQPTASKGAAPARICTAQTGNNYHRYGVLLREKLKGTVDVEVIETRGSWENIERIDSSPRLCDAVIAQEDAYILHQFEKPSSGLTMDRTATLFPEYVHLLCPQTVQAQSLSELDPEKHSIIVNEYGSGSYITWRLFRRLNPDYKRFQIVEKGVDEAMLRILDRGAPACFFYVSGLGGHTLNTADNTFGAQLRLVGIDDPKLTRKVGRDNRQIYRPSRIDVGVYKKLQTTSIMAPTVAAVFFLSPEWKARYPEAARQLASALLQVIGESND